MYQWVLCLKGAEQRIPADQESGVLKIDIVNNPQMQTTPFRAFRGVSVSFINVCQRDSKQTSLEPSC